MNEEKIPLISKPIHNKLRKIVISTVNSYNENYHNLVSNKVKTSKYNIFTFLPLVLLEQFRKLANVYFLIISIFQVIPGLSPTGRFTTLFPLCIVIIVSMIKEFYEDIKRHRDDNTINNKKVQYWKNEEWKEIQWKDIKVGDILFIKRKEAIPADLILLSSSEPNGSCYVETSQLDGETTLKIKESLTSTRIYQIEMNHNERHEIEVDEPNPDLFYFKGKIVGKKQEAIGINQLILRGSVIEDTEWIIGVTVYIGNETKQLQNAKGIKIKRSSIERKSNIFVIGMFILELIFALISTIMGSIWRINNKYYWYLETQDKIIPNYITTFITFVILYNNLVPISLYISLEIVRIGQAYFINHDLDMVHKGKFAEVRTSNLNEQLGLVDYIFTDKTGTLTQNLMEFKTCFVDGIVYGLKNNELSLIKNTSSLNFNNKSNINNSNYEIQEFDNRKYVNFNPTQIKHDAKYNKHVNDFLRTLALCNTVTINTHTIHISYQASSNDEAALVHAASCCGFELCERSNDKIVINNQITNEKEEYKLLHIIPFDSDRKRMSIIVERNGCIMLYIKGSDTTVLPLTKTKEKEMKIIQNQINSFALEGYRVLVAGVRNITNIYEKWKIMWEDAINNIKEREKLIIKASQNIEQEIEIVGISGIEDKLQIGVTEAIEKLKEAGIKIWVLTGDKKETAFNIAKSCKIFKENVFTINGITFNEIKEQVNQSINLNEKNYIIDGRCIELILQLEKNILKKMLMNAESVVCCRCAPSQKAKIVEEVKKFGGTTLSIGDGANDCSMIRAAHVGIGISGEEGLHAVRSSDYAISQFRFLVKLLLVHGRYNYRRLSYVILYSFYKNIIMYLTQFSFLFFNGYSGTSLFENWTLSIYNVLFTFLPIIVFGIFDRDILPETLIMNPYLYKSIKSLFNYKTLILWVIEALIISIMVFFIPFSVCITENNTINGLGFGMYGFGYIVYTIVMLTVTIKVVLFSHEFNFIQYIAYFGSLIFYFGWGFVYGLITWIPPFTIGWDMFGLIYQLLLTPSFYLLILIPPLLLGAKEMVILFIKTIIKKDEKRISEEEVDDKIRKTKKRFDDVPKNDKELFLIATSNYFI
ncbi:hypothetical protein, conserved [Entamoeba dispar SAW760]|uniref:Phospholipid-transporting ATPase n=1 Tax=Entamoeba dispar (strain ATCC PRA-260 / SAW760) TaxID=370354 RepID=B0ERB7_ENTDS|nr:uncharacterized protein EDI_025160 [Entamoeba dispar SAW760]EDR22935.1 hypothetical protein, conserved [Entamoeba dispar SAW760]|eukprot:EDR22935.1 hypothetical protein, conserved [Entamoeba dispar SAW760]